MNLIQNSILLLLLLSSSTILITVVDTLALDCIGCLCIPSFGSLDMQCPQPPQDTKIHVNIQNNQPDTQASIECDDLNANQYTLLPNMNIGDINTVTFRKCLLPLGTPLNNIIKRLGITNVQRLFFERGHNENMQLIHLKGLTELKRLRLSGIDFTQMSDDIFTDLKNLNWLDLRSNHINLPNHIFAPLENLEFLELGHNKLQDILPGTFRNQKKLVHLNLWGNNLTNLMNTAFEDATAITDLDLSSNNIETLRSDLFIHLKNLTTIYLNGNRFINLPKGLFQSNLKLYQFRLNNNRVPLHQLPNGLFTNLTELADFQMTCDLKYLPNDLFTGLINLQNISLYGNLIELLPDKLLNDQINLRLLDLSSNQLKELPDFIFINTKNLRTLLLSNNQLVNISRNAFKGLNSLEILNLENNHLITLPANTFSAFMPNLQIILLQNNQLNFVISQDEMNSPFNGLHNLQILNLRNNSITRIYQDWMLELNHLKELDLSYNKLTQFSTGDLQFLSRDITINLTHNLITLINFMNIEILDFEQQKTRFDIDNNPIICDCDILHFVEFLRGNLAKNLHTVFDIHIGDLRCHSPIHLHDKRILELNTKELLCPILICPSVCQCWARPIDNHLIMNCTNSNLTNVPLIPNYNQTRLKYIELHIENNQIEELPSIINNNNMENVTEIHANHNFIKNLYTNNIPSQLSVLDLSYNHIKQLNNPENNENNSIFNVLNDNKNLQTLLLSNNDWQCDCNTLDLLSFVKQNYKKINDFTEMRCQNVNNLNVNERIIDIEPIDICPRDNLIIAVSIIIALLGLCIGIIAALYYKYQLEIKVWLFAHNMCLWFVTEQELDRDKKYDAFISYSHKDEDFITEYLVPELENGINNSFKLCLHIRDWVVGEFIPNQITKSVEDSRRTIVILSPNFLESIWGRMEFRAAHTAAINERRARVIVIIYGEIGDIDQLDPELRAYLKMNTYVKWGDPWFWDKLRYAMPHPEHITNNNAHHRNNHSNNNSNCGNGLLKSALKGSIDDRLELIKPIPVTPPLTTPPAEQANKNLLISSLNNGHHNNHLKTIITKNHGNQLQANTNTNQNQTLQQNGKLITNGGINGHVNGAFIINTNAKQSDV